MALPIRNNLSVGVDVGMNTLRAVALRQHGMKCDVVAAVECLRTPNHPNPTQLDVQRLMQAMERQGVTFSRVILGAPPERVLSSMIELPPRSSGAPIESLAHAELSKSLAGAFESHLWDLPDAARQSATEYLAIAYSHDDASELIAPFESEGIQILAIEPGITALARVTGSNNRVVLDIGSRGTRLYAYEGKNVLFARCVSHPDGASDPASIVGGFIGTIDYLVNRFPALDDATVVVLGQPELYEGVRQELLKEFDADITNQMVIDLAPRPFLRNFTFDSRWASAIGLATHHSLKGAA